MKISVTLLGILFLLIGKLSTQCQDKSLIGVKSFSGNAKNDIGQEYFNKFRWMFTEQKPLPSVSKQFTPALLFVLHEEKFEMVANVTILPAPSTNWIFAPPHAFVKSRGLNTFFYVDLSKGWPWRYVGIERILLTNETGFRLDTNFIGSKIDVTFCEIGKATPQTALPEASISTVDEKALIGTFDELFEVFSLVSGERVKIIGTLKMSASKSHYHIGEYRSAKGESGAGFVRNGNSKELFIVVANIAFTEKDKKALGTIAKDFSAFISVKVE